MASRTNTGSSVDISKPEESTKRKTKPGNQGPVAIDSENNDKDFVILASKYCFDFLNCGTHFKPALKHFDSICTKIAKAGNGIFQEILAPKNFVPSGNFERFKTLVDTWEEEYQTRQKQLITPPDTGRRVSCVDYEGVIRRAREKSKKTVVFLGDFW